MTPVIDAFISHLPESARRRFAEQEQLVGLRGMFGDGHLDDDRAFPETVLAAMEAAGVDRCIVTTGLVGDGLGTMSTAVDEPGTCAEALVAACAPHPGRLRVALTVDQVPSIRAVTELIEHSAAQPVVCAIRVIPMLVQTPINDRLWYPVYERCEALDIPVTINVGIPGPRVKGSCQHAMLLDDVLVDFPDLTVVGAHMGHPWEQLLISLMMKYPNLHLMNSGYLAKYLDPAVVQFMASSRGISKLIFASDYPLVGFERALEHARALPLPGDAMAAFLGGNAARVFRWPTEAPTT